MRTGFGVGERSRRLRFGVGDRLRLDLDFSDGFFRSSSFLTAFLLGLLLRLFDSGFLFSLARAALDESLELLDDDEEDDRELLPELELEPLELLLLPLLLLEPLRLLESELEDESRFLRSLERSFLSTFSEVFFESSFLLEDDSLSLEETAMTVVLLRTWVDT
uniref:Uncharacterized protein n=1 Tax=Cacopsylla melanoneura TaxID=428564 RepID=A0A8D9E9P7_9HEMI